MGFVKYRILPRFSRFIMRAKEIISIADVSCNCLTINPFINYFPYLFKFSVRNCSFQTLRPPLAVINVFAP